MDDDLEPSFVGGADSLVRVFLSYRRDDVPDAADRLTRSLIDALGKDQVFLDVDSIEIGARFADVVGKWVGRCDVLLVVIGRGWLAATDGAGNRRLDDADDYVRLEIEAGLARDIRVVPALIHDARMPTAAELPVSLVPMLARNAVGLSRTHWDLDVQRLVQALQRVGVERAREAGEPDGVAPAATYVEREPGEPQNGRLVRRLVDSLADYAVIILDRSGVVLSWNAGATQIEGYDAGEMVGENFARLYGEEAANAGHPELQLETAARLGRYDGDEWLIRKNRTDALWAHVVIIPLYGDDGNDEIVGFGMVVQDITAEKQTTDQLHSALDLCKSTAKIDSLTGLWNRGAWDDALNREVARAQRYGLPLCVGILDVDHFKQINDQHGHEMGDRVLKKTSRTWRNAVRPTDVLARYGGEEFALALPDCDIVHAQVVVERLRKLIPKPESGSWSVTCSAGLAQWDSGESAERLMKRADTALYRAKAEGRDRITTAAPPVANAGET